MTEKDESKIQTLFFFVCLILFLFWRVVFKTVFLYAALAVLELCKPDWPQTGRSICLSGSQVLGLKVYATTTGKNSDSNHNQPLTRMCTVVPQGGTMKPTSKSTQAYSTLHDTQIIMLSSFQAQSHRTE